MHLVLGSVDPQAVVVEAETYLRRYGSSMKYSGKKGVNVPSRVLFHVYPDNISRARDPKSAASTVEDDWQDRTECVCTAEEGRGCVQKLKLKLKSG
jgi:hypothetical protein